MAESLFSVIPVVSKITADSIELNEDGSPKISAEDQALDSLDDFNHPRFRRALILRALQEHYGDKVSFVVPSRPERDLQSYDCIHNKDLLDFISTAWTRWEGLGEEGRDPASSLITSDSSSSDTGIIKSIVVPALIPINMPLGRDGNQRPSKSVMGQIGYYCTDTCTPIFGFLFEELKMDAAILRTAVDEALTGGVSYALPTHPGHHAATDSFGGYCYVNHAARALKLLQQSLNGQKVAILDIDYHCGNGTASIFYQDPSVLVVSIHCDPDFDYPFHNGFSDELGQGDGVGATLHIPLAPGTKWNVYAMALKAALDRIVSFDAVALVVSLGLDTHERDPCAIRRAGFCLSGKDYWEMGSAIGARVGGLPTVFVQEGGYRMDAVGKAAADVLVGYCSSS